MAVRIVLTLTAAPGKAQELAAAYRTRGEEVMQEPGCEQFEAFQSVSDPNRFVVMERWSDAAALEAHAKLNTIRPTKVRVFCVDNGQREDYEYNRTR
jgi:quinol monooxygenase YgiN